MIEIIELLHDYVAIKVDEIKDRTASGILLAEQIKTYPSTGIVTHVAKDVKTIKPGNRVEFKVYASTDIDERLTVIPYSGIIAVIK